MRFERAVVAAAVVAIVGLTLATGPVGILEVSAPGGNGLEDPGTGTATVEVLSEPDSVALVDSDDGQDLLHLEVPATTVALDNVTGNPILSYTVALDEVGVASDAVAFLGQGESDTLEVAIDRQTFQPHEVENVTEARLSLTVRGDTETTLFEKTVDVERDS